MNGQRTGEVSREHDCYRCHPEADTRLDPDVLDTAEATFADGGEEISYTSGYGAREIAKRRAAEMGGRVFINTVSPSIRLPDLGIAIGFAVSKGDVYTVRPTDAHHDTSYRSYWRPV